MAAITSAVWLREDVILSLSGVERTGMIASHKDWEGVCCNFVSITGLGAL